MYYHSKRNHCSVTMADYQCLTHISLTHHESTCRPLAVHNNHFLHLRLRAFSGHWSMDQSTCCLWLMLLDQPSPNKGLETRKNTLATVLRHILYSLSDSPQQIEAQLLKMVSQLIKAYFIISFSVFLVYFSTLILASWNHLPNKLLVLKSWPQCWLLAEYKLRQ